MAVVVKYVVVRNGEEKMTFATKKEADAHDRMLDIADNLFYFLGRDDELNLDEELRESLSLFLARNSDQVMNILKGIPFKKTPGETNQGRSSDTDQQNSPDKKRGGKSKKSGSGAGTNASQTREKELDAPSTLDSLN